MTWTIQWSKKAVKQLRKLRQEGQKIYDAVGELQDDPYTPTKQLVGTNQRTYRVGDYRVILQLVREQVLIYVVKVDKRGRVYEHN